MNDLQSEMDQIEKRTRRSWFDDGLVEILAGCAVLLIAGYLLLTPAFQGRAPGVVFNIAFAALVILLTFAVRRAIREAKDRYVHPRTGYVSLARPQRHRWANAALGCVMAALVAFALTRAPVLRDWIPALIGLLLAVAFLAISRKTGMLRFSFAGLSCVVVGLLLSMLRLNEDLGAGMIFAWLGIVLVVGGATALRVYMRNAPLARPGSRSGDSAGEDA